MKVLEGKNGVQQEETSYEASKRMDHDDTNVDMIVEDKGTDEPAVNIYEEYSKEKEMKVLESENGIQQEETSYEASKRLDYDNNNDDIIVEDKGTNEPAMNIHEEYSIEEEMKVLENKNGVQQKEELYETSKRMDYDNSNGDKIVENKGTKEPAGIIRQKNPRKRINDEALERIK